jgi:effector-binding domain-containing protein
VSAEPRLVDRPQQPYLGITGRVTMRTIPAIADRLPEVFAHLAARGLASTGPAFFRYHLIDMERELEIEVGVPVAAPAAADGEIRPGVLPAGRYATVDHVGHFDGLVAATGRLLAWADRRGLRWDATGTPDGERWGCRLELYHTDPREEPDPARWRTELAFRLAD